MTREEATLAPMVAQAAAKMTRGTTLQEAVEQGVERRCRNDLSWRLDTITATELSTPMYWDNLTGEPFDAQAVRLATRELANKYLRG